MNKRLDYKNQMFWAVLKVLKKYKMVWESIPVMVNLEKELSDELIKIKETAELAGVSLSGLVEDKNVTIQSLNEIVFEHAATLATFAKRTSNIELLNEVGFAKSYLDGLKQSEVLRLAERILKLLNDNLKALADYGITNANIEEIKIVTDHLSEAIPLTKLSKAEHKATNEKLDKQVAQTEELLKTQLDNMMVPFLRKNPDFYNAYKNSRDVTIYGVRHQKDEPPVDDNDKVA